jgi:hypothetical protein
MHTKARPSKMPRVAASRAANGVPRELQAGWRRGLIVYTQQGRARSRRFHPSGTAYPALMGQAVHSVEAKAVVRIEVAVAVSPCMPWPELRCGFDFFGGGGCIHSKGGRTAVASIPLGLRARL